MEKANSDPFRRRQQENDKSPVSGREARHSALPGPPDRYQVQPFSQKRATRLYPVGIRQSRPLDSEFDLPCGSFEF